MAASKNLSNINIGTSPNAGDGDVLRDAFIKVNQNFNDNYNNGQFVSYGQDQKLLPGYTWDGDRDTGIYHAGTGQIGFALNGLESLLLNEDGTIKWYAKQLATQDYVTAQLNTFTGGISAANIVVSTGSGNVNVTVNGVPAVATLPTSGNYQGRIVFYNGDVWIYSSYPTGNGTGLSADSGIARAAGSDSRWVRFRGDQAVSIGLVRPAIAAEGTTFYETANAKIYMYLSGAWKTLSSLITSNSPSGLEVLVSLPSVGDAGNYSGRTVIVGSTAYIFVSGAWQQLSSYVGANAATGGGISSGILLPPAANVGELFRLTITSGISLPGLYIYDGGAWNTLTQYTANTGTASIKTLTGLPLDVRYYNAGDLIIVSGKTYILNIAKTSWDLFTPGANTTVTNIVLNAGQVGTTQLANASVTNIKLISNSITSDKLVSNTITTRELSDASVTDVKLAANSITSAKIQSGVITGREIASNSIPGSRLQLGSITSDLLAPGAIAVNRITANNLSELATGAGTITSGIFKSADNKMIIDLNNKYIRIEL
jgi:hypothetical protein